MTVHLLGFDAREVGPRVEAQWDSERRALYSLRPCKLPLSVDKIVWPTAFIDNDYGNEGWIARPDWIGVNDWDDLSAMESCLLRAGADPSGRTYWKIAVTWHREGGAEQPGRGGPYVEPTTPAVIEPSWPLLGYDVADPSISGLLNCGYSNFDPSLRTLWGARLNEHHLFSRLDHAFEFRQLTNLRVREHAPFFVLGLWRVG